MTVGMRMESAGSACDNDTCSVLVYNPEGPRVNGAVIGRVCPSCGNEGFQVRFGISIDEITS